MAVVRATVWALARSSALHPLRYPAPLLTTACTLHPIAATILLQQRSTAAYMILSRSQPLLYHLPTQLFSRVCIDFIHLQPTW